MDKQRGLQLLEQAKKAIKTNHRVEGRRLLEQSLDANPDNYAAWLWLSSVTASPKQAAVYVAQAERLHPGHPAIEKARAWVNKRLVANSIPQKESPIVHSTQTVSTPPPIHLSPPSKKEAVIAQRNWKTAVFRSGLFVILFLLLAGSSWMVWQWTTGGNGTEETAALAQAISASPVGLLKVDQNIVMETAVSTPVPTATPTVIQIAAKNIAQQSQPRATWTVTPIPSPTPTPSPTAVPTFTSHSYNSSGRPFGVGDYERWIDVNLNTQTLTAYEGDTAVFSTLISSGTTDHPTVTGQFRVWLRYQSQTMDGTRLGYDYYLENVPYVMYFFEDYAIHGAYWHNNFGNPMSHGCVNVEPNDAEWLYGWASEGTLVNVH